MVELFPKIELPVKLPANTDTDEVTPPLALEGESGTLLKVLEPKAPDKLSPVDDFPVL